MKASIRNIAVLIACALLGGCATKFQQVNLVPVGITRSSAPFDLELKTVTVAIAAPDLQTGNVRMNATFPPLWRDALQNVIDQAGVFKDDAARKVTVAAVIKKFDFNPSGFSNTIKVEADYSVVDRSNGQILFEKDITNSASAGAGDEWVAQNRVIMLWNKATQENIRTFVQALKESGIK
jgi:hypothetical protein